MVVTAKVRRKQHLKLPTSIAGPSKVKVGFPAGKAGGEIIDRAFWQEFGTTRIPERPFLRSAMRDNRSKYLSAMATSARKILLGQTSLTTTMGKLGIVAQGDVQQSISTWTTPPNAPSTIAKKGSSQPLIDTGQMRASVSWQVFD